MQRDFKVSIEADVRNDQGEREPKDSPLVAHSSLWSGLEVLCGLFYLLGSIDVDRFLRYQGDDLRFLLNGLGDWGHQLAESLYEHADKVLDAYRECREELDILRQREDSAWPFYFTRTVQSDLTVLRYGNQRWKLPAHSPYTDWVKQTVLIQTPDDSPDSSFATLTLRGPSEHWITLTAPAPLKPGTFSDFESSRTLVTVEAKARILTKYLAKAKGQEGKGKREK